MNHQEIEELLHTDMEVRHEVEEIHLTRLQSKKPRLYTLPAAATAENCTRGDQDDAGEEAIWSGFGPAIPWRILARESPAQGVAEPLN